MWRPGQLITIKGIVYRIKRINDNLKVFPCKRCIFEKRATGCTFPRDKGGWTGCVKLTPGDCYFERVYPKS